MRRKIDIILNVILIILEILGIVATINSTGYFAFVYYTQDSNLFALVITIVYLYYKLTKKEIPRLIHNLRFSSVLCLMVTFLVVIFILIPSYNFNYNWFLFEGANLYFHLLCPILLFILYMFFDEEYKCNRIDYITVIIPTIIYATILIILNVINLVEGPYPFLLVHKNPIYMSVIWFVVIVGGAFGFSHILNKVKGKFYKK